MLISIVIPAYNEEKRIGQTLDTYCREFYPGMAEFIVVLNACRDNTRQVVEAAQRRFGRAIIIHELKEGGKGRAIKYGFQQARGDLIGYLDADGSTSPAEFRKLVETILQEKFDGAIAARWGKGAKIIGRTTFLRTLASYGFHYYTKLLFNFPFRDTQCGAKIFRRQVIEQIVEKISVVGWAIDIDLLLLMKKAGCKIKEVPTVWVDTSNEELSGIKLVRASWQMFASLLKMRFSH